MPRFRLAPGPASEWRSAELAPRIEREAGADAAEQVALDRARGRDQCRERAAQQRHAARSPGEQDGVDRLALDTGLVQQRLHGLPGLADELADGGVEVVAGYRQGLARRDAVHVDLRPRR